MLCLSSVACLALLPHIVASHPFTAKRLAVPPISSRNIALFQTEKRRARDTGLTGGPYYYGDFNLGGNAVSAIVDTGSGDLVVRSDTVPSSAYSDVQGSCSDNYGARGAINGQVATGVYHFADYDVGGRFCLVDPSDLDSNFNAILGLGFPPPQGSSVAAQYGDGPLEQFAERGLGSFAMYLATQPGGGGAFTVNGYNPDYVADGEDFIYESRGQGQPHWAFPLAGDFQVSGGEYQWGVSHAIVDSGTPTINVPAAAASAIWQAVGANSDGTYNDCNPGGDPITFTSQGGNGFTIEAVHYVIHNGGGCINAFRPGNSASQILILGTPFMKQYYTYFDVNNQEMGFVKSAG